MADTMGGTTSVEENQAGDKNKMRMGTGMSSSGEPKVFVGQIDKNLNEEELRKHMEAYGQVQDVKILRNPKNGESKCCAMVLFSTQEEAENAIEKLDGKHLVEGEGKKLVVNFAKSKKEDTNAQNTSLQNKDRKLFIGQVPTTMDTENLRPLFEPFGTLEELFIHIRDGVHQGCAFARYSTHEEAVAAISAMHESMTLEGAKDKLVVKFAESRKQNNPNGHFGQKTGLVGVKRTFAQAQAADRMMGMDNMQMAQLNGLMGYANFPPTYGITPAGLGYFNNGAMSNSMSYGFPGAMNYMPVNYQMYPNNNPANGVIQQLKNMGQRKRSAQQNCKWKLFIGQIDYSMTEDELCSMFSQAGDIEHCHILRTPEGKSRGCGFIVYADRFMADTAISQFDGRELPGSNGKRSLTVKYAKDSQKM